MNVFCNMILSGFMFKDLKSKCLSNQFILQNYTLTSLILLTQSSTCSNDIRFVKSNTTIIPYKRVIFNVCIYVHISIFYINMGTTREVGTSVDHLFCLEIRTSRRRRQRFPGSLMKGGIPRNSCLTQGKRREVEGENSCILSQNSH